MMTLALAVAGMVAAAPVNPNLAEAAHAIAAGRLDQARAMIGAAVAAGEKRDAVDRLLADLAYQSGRDAEALTRYRALVATNPSDLVLAERAGLAALKTGEVALAQAFIQRAAVPESRSWRAWNALGVLADFRRDWDAADAAYSRAATLAPNQAEVLNNQGWSQLLRGNWADAIGPLGEAAALDPASRRIAANLELASAALAEELPRRQRGEDDGDWAARLNDAGVVARLRGDNARAIAAFSQAIEARNLWYERAANNLQLTGPKH